jgi:hypothetical protein
VLVPDFGPAVAMKTVAGTGSGAPSAPKTIPVRSGLVTVFVSNFPPAGNSVLPEPSRGFSACTPVTLAQIKVVIIAKIVANLAMQLFICFTLPIVSQSNDHNLP